MKVMNNLDIKDVLESGAMSTEEIIALFQEQLQEALDEIHKEKEKEKKKAEKYNRNLEAARENLTVALANYIECLIPDINKYTLEEIKQLENDLKAREEQVKKYIPFLSSKAATSKYIPEDEDDTTLFNFISNNFYSK